MKAWKLLFISVNSEVMLSGWFYFGCNSYLVHAVFLSPLLEQYTRPMPNETHYVDKVSLFMTWSMDDIYCPQATLCDFQINPQEQIFPD